MNNFWKEKTSWKLNFWYQRVIHLIIECNKVSCSEHITGGGNIYLCGCVSLLAPKCAVCVCVFVCVWYQIRVPVKKHIMCQTAVNFMPCCIKHIEVLLVPRPDMCKSILLLSKIVHQMWHDHPFSQRNRATERTVGWGLKVTGKWVGAGQNLKKGCGQYSGGSSENRRVSTFLPTM